MSHRSFQRWRNCCLSSSDMLRHFSLQRRGGPCRLPHRLGPNPPNNILLNSNKPAACQILISFTFVAGTNILFHSSMTIADNAAATTNTKGTIMTPFLAERGPKRFIYQRSLSSLYSSCNRSRSLATAYRFRDMTVFRLVPNSSAIS